MKSFNLRVYGLLVNENNEVLISEEFRFGKPFTKFPGGGLELGEGLKEGLIREFQEELSIEIEPGALFYVNDFFLESAYDKNHQLVCFYYWVHFKNWKDIFLGEKELPLSEDGEQQRWISLSEISAELMTFPIDKVVADKLLKFQTQSDQENISREA